MVTSDAVTRCDSDGLDPRRCREVVRKYRLKFLRGLRNHGGGDFLTANLKKKIAARFWRRGFHAVTLGAPLASRAAAMDCAAFAAFC